jgi:hypothetical protein
MGGHISSTTAVTLGSNVEWDQNSEFMSNSTDASLIAEKMSNGTILMYFKGDE